MSAEAETDNPNVNEIIVRVLNPEIQEELEMAKFADRASTEAYTPGAGYTHDEMQPEQLRAFMLGDQNHLTRYLIVDPDKYFQYVDRTAFEAEVSDNPALAELQKRGVVGFTFLYRDDDIEFIRRANEVRRFQGLPADHPVTELNFWYVPGVKDEPVEKATQKTLQEFAKVRTGETTTVMFADAGDVKDAYAKESGKRLLLKDIASDPKPMAEALSVFQDSRILKRMEFGLLDERIRYAPDSRFLDFVYTRTIG